MEQKRRALQFNKEDTTVLSYRHIGRGIDRRKPICLACPKFFKEAKLMLSVAINAGVIVKLFLVKTGFSRNTSNLYQGLQRSLKCVGASLFFMRERSEAVRTLLGDQVWNMAGAILLGK
ncbi:hypothetical protein [Herbaspirillum frisingense]|uniref:hypothetical protein n=1 Tax=Herbaspirillum frisingense TaxID=92645 RepID=UPI001F38822A|nr:hypothetical protein [Herbaspirillum frisingense]UIN22218.1 hypothetical protein LAZ82_03650 [Herbaspirillum frisingense]